MPNGAIVTSAVATLGWLSYAPRASSAGRLGLGGAALAAWIAAVAITRHRAAAPSVLWCSGLLVLAAAVVRSPFGSRDLWSYVMQGRILVRHHASPYLARPNDFPYDPILRQVATGWRESRSPYGPLFALIAAAGSWLAGDSLFVNRTVHQGLAGLAVVAVAVVQHRRGRARTVPFLVLCPPVVAIVNGGHNDLLVGALAFGGAALLADATDEETPRRTRRRTILAAILMSAAALIKLTALLAAIAAILWLWRRREIARVRVFGGVGVVSVLTTYAVAGGWRALRPLVEGGSRISRASIPGVLDHALGPVTVRYGTAAVFGGGITLVIAIVAGWSSRLPSPTGATTWSFLGFIALAPFVLPWYAGWVLPSAADQPDGASGRAAVLLCSAVWLAYADPPGDGTTAVAHALAWLPAGATGALVVGMAFRTVRRFREPATT